MSGEGGSLRVVGASVGGASSGREREEFPLMSYLCARKNQVAAALDESDGSEVAATDETNDRSCADVDTTTSSAMAADQNQNGKCGQEEEKSYGKTIGNRFPAMSRQEALEKLRSLEHSRNREELYRERWELRALPPKIPDSDLDNLVSKVRHRRRNRQLVTEGSTSSRLDLEVVTKEAYMDPDMPDWLTFRQRVDDHSRAPAPEQLNIWIRGTKKSDESELATKVTSSLHVSSPLSSGTPESKRQNTKKCPNAFDVDKVKKIFKTLNSVSKPEHFYQIPQRRDVAKSVDGSSAEKHLQNSTAREGMQLDCAKHQQNYKTGILRKNREKTENGSELLAPSDNYWNADGREKKVSFHETSAFTKKAVDSKEHSDCNVIKKTGCILQEQSNIEQSSTKGQHLSFGNVASQRPNDRSINYINAKVSQSRSKIRDPKQSSEEGASPTLRRPRGTLVQDSEKCQQKFIAETSKPPVVQKDDTNIHKNSATEQSSTESSGKQKVVSVPPGFLSQSKNIMTDLRSSGLNVPGGYGIALHAVEEHESSISVRSQLDTYGTEVASTHSSAPQSVPSQSETSSLSGSDFNSDIMCKQFDGNTGTDGLVTTNSGNTEQASGPGDLSNSTWMANYGFLYTNEVHNSCGTSFPGHNDIPQYLPVSENMMPQMVASTVSGNSTQLFRDLSSSGGAAPVFGGMGVWCPPSGIPSPLPMTVSPGYGTAYSTWQLPGIYNATSYMSSPPIGGSFTVSTGQVSGYPYAPSVLPHSQPSPLNPFQGYCISQHNRAAVPSDWCTGPPNVPAWPGSGFIAKAKGRGRLRADEI